MMIPFLGTVSVVLMVLRTWPQAIRIARAGDASGVSASTWSLVLGANVVWLVLGAVTREPTLIAANILASMGSAAVLVAIGRRGGTGAMRPLMVILASTLITLGAGSTQGAAAIRALAVGVSIVMFIPQVVKVFRSPIAGVSPMTWLMSVVSSVIWLTYGLLTREPAILMTHAVVFPCAVIVTTRLLVFPPPSPTTEQHDGTAAKPGALEGQAA